MSSSVNDVGWLWKPLKIAQATAEGESFTSLRESFALIAIVCERNSTIAHKTPSLDGAGGVRGWHGMEDGARSEMKNTLCSFYTVNGL